MDGIDGIIRLLKGLQNTTGHTDMLIGTVNLVRKDDMPRPMP